MKQGDRWIIFYEDGTTFCSNDGSPWDAPRLGVQHIAQSKDEKDSDWFFINQFDQYYYEKVRGGWCEARDLLTVMQHLLRAYKPCIIFGSMVNNETWFMSHKIIKKYCVKYRGWLIGKVDERPPINWNS